MSDEPAPVNRLLTDDERQLLANLTIWCIAEQTGVSDEEASDALGRLTQEGRLYMEGDAVDAYVKVKPNGHVLVHCTREWLAFHAHSGEQVSSDELRRSLTEPPLSMAWPWRCTRCHRNSDNLDNDGVCARCRVVEKP